MRPYFSEDGITIYHGDCREVLPQLTFDVLLTDPPYGVNLGSARTDPRSGHGLHKQPYASFQDDPENYRYVVVPAIKQALDMSTRGMVFSVPPQMWDLPRPDVIGGIYLPAAVGRNVWGWSNLVHLLLYGSAPGMENGSRPTAIYSTDVAEVNGHPTVKPLSWILWAMKHGSCAGEVICDPFMGSGTTLRAAKDLGHKAIGIEIEEEYCEIAAKRLAQKVLAFE